MSRSAPPAPAPTAAPTTPDALVRRTLRRQRGPLARATALVTVWQVSEAAVPVLIGVAIDRAVATGDLAALAVWAGALALLFLVLSTGYRLGARVALRAEQVEGHRLRTEVSARVLDPRGARTTQLPGDLLTVATSDAEMVSFVIRQVAFTVAAVSGFVVVGVALAAIDLLLAGLVLVGVPLVLVLTSLLSRPLTARSEARQEAVGLATGLATDLVQGLRPLKGVGAEGVALERYRRRSATAARASVSASGWTGLLSALASGVGGLFLAAVALVAGTRALDGDISIGELIAVVGLAQFVAEPLRLLAALVAELAQSRASAARILAVLGAAPLVHAGARRPDGAGASRLVLDDVRHGTLDGLSLRLGPTELVCLVAEDPADAESLLALLRGEAEPASGRVLLDGEPLTELDLAETRARLLVADHQVDLFEGDLRTNLDPGGLLDDDALARVLADSAADEVVAGRAAGLDEPVAVGGTTLSGGQRQRVGLARALGLRRPLLVLHDPTTAVDPVTEERIATALRGAREGRATLVVASSPALLAVADRVAHVRRGRVVASGSHAELMDDVDYRAAVLR